MPEFDAGRLITLLEAAESGEPAAATEALSYIHELAAAPNSGAERFKVYADSWETPLTHIWEVRLRVSRLLPELALTASERARAIQLLEGYWRGTSQFVRAWALDSLARFAEDDLKLRSTVMALVEEALNDSSSAVRARARAIAKRL